MTPKLWLIWKWASRILGILTIIGFLGILGFTVVISVVFRDRQTKMPGGSFPLTITASSSIKHGKNTLF